MAIPDFQTLMRPVLEYLADGQVHRSRDITEAMADHFNLTAEERAEMLPSRRSKTIANRVGWTLTHLTQAGLIDSAGRGLKLLTAEGRLALDRYPERVDMKALETYPLYRAFRERKRAQQSSSGDLAVEPAANDDREAETPAELAERAERINRAAVEGEVLAAALKLTPTGFEELVLRLLTAMGYGDMGQGHRTPASGDGGIDGIISRDPLGLDRIYLQAKKYTDTPVDRPAIQGFAGALMSKQGDRGVFLTTSRFTSGAREEADRIAKRIELIDGQRLAQLLVHYEVGVQLEQAMTLYRIDEDYFDGL